MKPRTIGLKTIFVSLFFLAPLSIAATEKPVEHFDISVSGNTRTTDHHLKRLTRRCLQPITPENSLQDQLKQCILNSKLFSSVEVSLENHRITVVAIDRWTLLPIPSYSASKQGSNFGLYLVETNALGHGVTVVAGATSGSTSSNRLLLYREKSLLMEGWLTSAFFSKKVADNEIRQKSQSLDGYRGTSIATGFEIGKIIDISEISLSINKSSKKFARFDSYQGAKDIELWGYQLKLRLKNQEFKWYYEDGWSFEGRFGGDLKRDHPSKEIKNASARMNWAGSTYTDQVLKLQLFYFAMSGGSTLEALSVGDTTGIRGSPKGSIWAENLGSLSADYLYPVLKSNSGTMVTGLFADIASFKLRSRAFNDRARSRSYGIGLYYFLKNIAVPGFGLEIGNNDDYDGSFTKVSVGVAL